jgi:hypothetical protein
MDYSSTVAWGGTLLGLVLAWALGRRSLKPSSGIGVAIAVGFISLLAVNFGLAACVEAKFCIARGDASLGYLMYPIWAFPGYWFIAHVSAERPE